MNLRNLVGIAALSGLALVAPAQAGEAPVNVQASKDPASGYSSYKQLKVPEGKAKTAYFRVQNTTDSDADATLGEEIFTEGSVEYRIDWYKGKKPSENKKISEEIREEGFNFNSKAGKSRTFAVRIKRKEGTSPLCLRADLNVPGSFDTAILDVNGPSCVQRPRTSG